jgi:hypothetical protein
MLLHVSHVGHVTCRVFFDMSCSALTASWFWIITCMLGWKTFNRLHLANDHMETVVLTGSMRNIVPSCESVELVNV